MANATTWTHYPRERPVPIVYKAGWPPGPVWTGAENLVPTGIRSSDHPPYSESLYRLKYRGPPSEGCILPEHWYRAARLDGGGQVPKDT